MAVEENAFPSASSASVVQPGSQQAAHGAALDERSSLVIEMLREMQEWRRAWQREREDAVRERRSERRWRLVFQGLLFGVPVLASVLYVVFLLAAAGFSLGPLQEAIGLVRISGEIRPYGLAAADKVVPALERAFANARVRAVVLSIDSPGGAPAEAERIYKAVDALRARYRKPVVAVIGNTGASAGYMIAMHADSVHAASYSLVGSIGAVMTGWDLHRALDRIEVSQRVYASGSLKAMLNPFAPNTREADTKARALVSGLGREFVEDLYRRRGSHLRSGVDFATGEVWGGYEALRLGLVDSVSTLEEVLAARWPGIPVHDFGPKPGGGVGSLFGTALADWSSLVGRASEALYPVLR